MFTNSMNVMLCYQQSRNILLFHGHDTKSRYVYLHHFFLNEHMDDHSHMLVTCVQRADDSFMKEDKQVPVVCMCVCV